MKNFEVIYRPNPDGRTVLRMGLAADSIRSVVAAVLGQHPNAVILAVTDPEEVRNLSPKHVEELMNHLENSFMKNGEIPPSPIVAEIIRQAP